MQGEGHEPEARGESSTPQGEGQESEASWEEQCKVTGEGLGRRRYEKHKVRRETLR